MNTVVNKNGFQGGFRQSMAWVHSWAGLLLSAILYFIFITGSFGYFNVEIDYWMKPELANNSALPSSEVMATQAIRYLQQKVPNAKSYFINLPVGRHNDAVYVYAEHKVRPESGGRFFNDKLDPQTGLQLAHVRETGGAEALYTMHYWLHYMPYSVAIYIVGIATLFMFAALITGVVIHKKIFTDFFTLRFNKDQRSWLDLHNLSSVLALPFFLMITYSGLIFYTFEYFPGVKWLTIGTDNERNEMFNDTLYPKFAAQESLGKRAPLVDLSKLIQVASSYWPDSKIRYINIINPDDETAVVRIERELAGVSRAKSILTFDGVTGAQKFIPEVVAPNIAFADGMIGLHEGHFANIFLRWLYFLSGLLGAAMIATGLVLWVKKRRQRLIESLSVVFVERASLGVVLGLPIGIGVYFWGNRLLPMSMADRAAWEINLLFIAWGLSFLHSFLRRLERAWHEQLMILAFTFIFIPLLNFFTTDVHLFITLSQGDWVRAGFDLCAMLFGIIVFLGCIRQYLFCPGNRNAFPGGE